MEIIIARHGETRENKKRLLMGHKGGNLTEEGLLQAQCFRAAFKDKHFDAIYSSDLKRAASTAKLVSEFHPNCPLYLLSDIRSRSYGSLTGKHISKRDLEHLPCDAESNKKLLLRAKRFLKKIYSKHREDVVLVISHNGFNKALFSIILDKPFLDVLRDQPDQPHGSYASFIIDQTLKSKTTKMLPYKLVKQLNSDLFRVP